MQLPEADERYLNEKGHTWELTPEGGGGCLVLSDFMVSVKRYDRSSSNLLIRIPKGYNMAGLDMFYLDPEIRVKATGAYPDKADVFEVICGRRWQRFSRHLIDTPWRPGIDGLATFLALIQRELQS